MSEYSNVKTGQLITLKFENREFRAIVIDPNGLGKGQPSVGLGMRGMERYAGVSQSTLGDWTVTGNNGAKHLKLPSGKLIRVTRILGLDGNIYDAVEASDWFNLAIDLIRNPGKTSKSLKNKLLDFIEWFVVKGFYAECYTILKGVYSAKDSRATSAWLNARQSGKYCRHQYTDTLCAAGVEGEGYGRWTNYIYQDLFGLTAKQIKQEWDLVRGSKKVARNYIEEVTGLEAVAFVEEMTVKMFDGNLADAHFTAIGLAKKKYHINFDINNLS